MLRVRGLNSYCKVSEFKNPLRTDRPLIWNPFWCLLQFFQLLDRTGNTFSWKIKNESIPCPKQLCQYRRLFQVPKIEFYNSTQFSIVDRDVTNSKNQESTESSFRGNETPNKLKPALFMLRTQTQSSPKSVKLI